MIIHYTQYFATRIDITAGYCRNNNIKVGLIFVGREIGTELKAVKIAVCAIRCIKGDEIRRCIIINRLLIQFLLDSVFGISPSADSNVIVVNVLKGS